MGKTKKPKLMSIDDVSLQTRQNGKVGPILPVFQHAVCHPASLVSSSSAKMSSDWESGNKVNIDLTISTDNMTYQSVEKNRNQVYTTYLAIRDKNTRKTRVVEVNPLVMKPKVTYPTSKNPLLLQEKSENETLAEKIEASKHLIKSFGQTKGQRFYDQQDRMKVDSSQIEEKVNKAAGAVTEDRLAAAPEQDKVEILPTRDETASKRELVYLIDNMLGKVELKALADAVDPVFLEYKTLADLQHAKNDKILSPMGVTILNQCIQSEGDIVQKASIALYMEGLIKFSRLRQGEMKKGPKSLQNFLPLVIKKKIFDKFSCGGAGNTRIITPELADRAICHIMVLGLLASNYKLDISLLTESVRVRPDHLKKLVAMVGAHIHNDSLSQSQFIVLKLPLATFNVNYIGRKKGGKK